MEHSGFYNAILIQCLQSQVNTSIWIESALQIKRSIGIQHGKNDRIDALRIASYALDFQRKAKLWKPKPKSLERLGLLISHRDRVVKNLLSLGNSLKEEAGFVDQDIHLEIEQISRPAIEALEQALADFDQQIEAILEKDKQLSHQAKIVTSIPGFGKVIASKLIIATHGFTQINKARSLACYAGVAPFEHRSSTSIKGKTRVSHFANKELKKMLHLAALVTIRKGNIMHDYFNRKVAQGKNKMSVINAIRNKLIHILMACINNNTIYQKNFNHSLEVT
jgi:transposase